jgi:hypothetical protein
MDAATRAVSTVVVAPPVVEEDEPPQALISAAHAAAAMATAAPRGPTAPVLGVGGLMCMRAYITDSWLRARG